MRRKLLCVSAAMIFGIWCAGISYITAVGAVLTAFLYVGVLYFVPKQNLLAGMGMTENAMKGLALACAVAMAIGAARMGIQTWYYEQAVPDQDVKDNSVKAQTLQDNSVTAQTSKYRAEVIKVSRKKDKPPKLTVKLLRMNDSGSAPVGHKCLVSWYAGKDKEDIWRLTGNIIEFSAVIDKPDTAGNPRCFDYREYLRSQGISCVAKAESIKVIKRNGSFLGRIRRMIISFREGFIEFLCGIRGNSNAAQESPGETADSSNEAVLRGILFGDTDSMDEDMSEDFRRNGTAHVLAVSGLHIGLLYSIFRTLRKKFAIPGMTLVFLIILGIYGTMTLWTVSVTRAAALIVMLEVGNRLDRPFDMITSLGVVSMLVLLNEPYALYGTSFVMSYLAALSIGMVLPVIKRHVPDQLSDSIKTSLAVQIGLTPYIAYTFNIVPLGGLIINIPIVFMLTIVVIMSAAAVPLFILCSILMPSAIVNGTGSTASPISLTFQAFKLVLDVLINLMVLINRQFADLDILSPDVVSPPLFVIAAFYGVLFLACSESFKVARLRRNMKIVAPEICLIGMIVLLAGAVSVSDIDKSDILMVDVGQGDCMHLRFNKTLLGCTNVIIDGGGSDNYNVGKKTLKPYFLKNGVRKVDLALATHLHTDHYKGIEELAEEKMVRKMITVGRTGDKIKTDWSNNRIEVIWPDERDPDSDDENKNSLIFKVYINGMTVLITGDLGEEGEHALVDRYRGTDVLNCDVLKVCHHGSKYSSSEEFLEAVSPKVALIGVGKNNTYGHPSKEAIERLEACGAAVFRTDEDGAIGVRMTKKGLKVTTVK